MACSILLFNNTITLTHDAIKCKQTPGVKPGVCKIQCNKIFFNYSENTHSSGAGATAPVFLHYGFFF